MTDAQPLRTATTTADERSTDISADSTTAGAAAGTTEGVATGTTEELDRQVRVLVDKGYPALGGFDAEGFTALVEPLRAAAAAHAPTGTPVGPSGAHGPGRAAFLLVVTGRAAPIEDTMPLTALAGRGRPGFVDHSYEEGALPRFTTVPEAAHPHGAADGAAAAPRAYLLLGADRGEEFCGAVPTDALEEIRRRGRSPLTIEEGIAFVTLFPEALEKNKCFSLAGSRCGDRRVPALWISKRAPKLGWCWEGNPHTWLGVASAAARASAV